MSKRKKMFGNKPAVKSPSRPVDQAMQADRAAKNTIRQQWLALLKNINVTDDKYPIYFTLPGAEGKDIELLIDEKILTVTETGAISDASANYCVAVENSPLAVLELQKRFPGLRILQQDVNGLLRGDSIVSYPHSDHQRLCQAHVINLDLQATLQGKLENDEASFHVIRWIEKFGVLHKESKHDSWHLLLTLNATVEWTDDLAEWVVSFLHGNFASIRKFSDLASEILPQDVFQSIIERKSIQFTNLALGVRQKILLILLPKAIAYILSKQGWKCATVLNAEYPGAGGAPMVTFIFSLSNTVGTFKPDALYSRTVEECLSNVMRITENGELQRLSIGDVSVG